MIFKHLISCLVLTKLIVTGLEDSLLQGIVSNQRGVSPIEIGSEGGANSCAFAGTVTLGGPFSDSPRSAQ